MEFIVRNKRDTRYTILVFKDKNITCEINILYEK